MSGNLADNSSKYGAIVLHGPHHVAVKSTTTYASRENTSHTRVSVRQYARHASKTLKNARERANTRSRSAPTRCIDRASPRARARARPRTGLPAALIAANSSLLPIFFTIVRSRASCAWVCDDRWRSMSLRSWDSPATEDATTLRMRFVDYIALMQWLRVK